MDTHDILEGARLAEEHLAIIDDNTLSPELCVVRIMTLQLARRLQSAVEFLEVGYQELRTDFVEIIQSPHGFIMPYEEE